jgi:hypothetical protein
MADEAPAKESEGTEKPKGPKWLVAFAGFLVLIVGIMASLDKIQSFMCRHNFDWFCPKEKVELEIGSWLHDIGGGWKVVITNPSEYSAEVVNANLKFDDPETPLLIPVLAGPEDWTSPPACNEDAGYVVHDVELKPKATTPLRMLLYAAEIKRENELAMSNIDKTIPNRNRDKCELQVNVRVGNGDRYQLTSRFDCSQLPGPVCRPALKR